MLASSHKPCAAANPMRRAKTPALQSPCKRVVTQKAAALCPGLPAGRCKHRPLRRGRLAARTACATDASLPATPFRSAGAGRSLSGTCSLIAPPVAGAAPCGADSRYDRSVPANSQCHLLLPAFAGIQQRTALRSSLRVLSASLTMAAFSAAFGSLQKRQPTADAVMKATSRPRPSFFMTSPHPSKQHPSTRSPPAKIPAPQFPRKQSTAHTCHPCNKSNKNATTIWKQNPAHKYNIIKDL